MESIIKNRIKGAPGDNNDMSYIWSYDEYHHYLHNQGHDACVIAPVPLCCNELRMATKAMIPAAEPKTQHGTCHKTAKINIIKGCQGIGECMWIQEKMERKNSEKHQTKEMTPNIDYNASRQFSTWS